MPSKGRFETLLTINALTACEVPFRVVVEKQEYDQYAAVVPADKLLVLPFRDKGLVATRNWIWEHSIKEGHARHWQLDDNIRCFYRLYKNKRMKLTPRTAGAAFACIEDFVERYENVAHAGMQYAMFAPARTKMPPLIFNTRVYSCHLVLKPDPVPVPQFL